MGIFGFLKGEKVLYYPGCLTKGVLKQELENYKEIFNKLKIDFVMLPDEENCCGLPVMNAGYRKDAVKLAKKNLKLFREKGIQKIVTNCPSCFHMFGSVYPKLVRDWNIPVEHATVTVLRALKKKGWKYHGYDEDREIVAYHDPCHLGRYSGVYDEPREVVEILGDVAGHFYVLFLVLAYWDDVWLVEQDVCCLTRRELLDAVVHRLVDVHLDDLRLGRVRVGVGRILDHLDAVPLHRLAKGFGESVAVDGAVLHLAFERAPTGEVGRGVAHERLGGDEVDLGPAAGLVERRVGAEPDAEPDGLRLVAQLAQVDDDLIVPEVVGQRHQNSLDSAPGGNPPLSCSLNRSIVRTASRQA